MVQNLLCLSHHILCISSLVLCRYCDKLKGAKIFPVAVRVVNGEVKGEWLEVGRVKSEGDEFTEVAVAMQRGLIAEHAKRLLAAGETKRHGRVGISNDW